MRLEEAIKFLAEKIADEIQDMFPDSDYITESDLDRIIYDVEILNSIQEEAIGILDDRGFIKEEGEEEDEE